MLITLIMNLSMTGTGVIVVPPVTPTQDFVSAGTARYKEDLLRMKIQNEKEDEELVIILSTWIAENNSN